MKKKKKKKKKKKEMLKRKREEKVCACDVERECIISTSPHYFFCL